MKNRRITAAVIIILVALLIAFGLDFNLYRSKIESRNNKTAASVGGRDYTAANFADRIGILINDPDSERWVKEMLGAYLKGYLLESGYPEVHLLQSGDYDGQVVDLVIRVNLKSDISRLPFNRKGFISYDFTTLSLYYGPEYYENEKISIRYSGEDSLASTGIISKRRATELLVENVTRGFVESINQNFNEKFNLNYPEKLEKIKPGRKDVELNKTATAGLVGEYEYLLPGTAAGIFIYQDRELGKRAVISFYSNSSIAELLGFYENFVDERYESDRGFADYTNGRKVYENYGSQEKLLIDIKYRTGERPFAEAEELEKKIINIFHWEPSQAVITIKELYGFYPGSEINKLKEELTEKDRDRDFAYFYALSRIRMIELQQRYWQEGVLDEQLLRSVLEDAARLEEFNKYPGARQYYEGRTYQQLGNMLRESVYLSRAAHLYRQIEQRYGARYFGTGAAKQLLMLKANPVYEERDYSYVLQHLDSDKYRNIDLSRAEVLYRMGRYEEAYSEMERTNKWQDRQLKLFTREKLSRGVNREDYPEDIREGSIDDIKWTLTRAFILKKTGNRERAEEEVGELKERAAEWRIFQEANDLSRKTGFEYDLIAYLNI